MSIGGTFRALGRVFDHWEGQDWTVSHVGMDETTLTDEGVRTVVELETSIHTALGCGSGQPIAAESVGIESDGMLELAIRVPLVPDDVRPDGLQIEETEVRTTDDDMLVVGLAVSIPSSMDVTVASGVAGTDVPRKAPTGSSESEAPQDEDASRDEDAEADDDGGIERHRTDVPPFEDTAYLRDVYEAHDTFAAMAGELDMDVTAETARRYMIDAGVHEPTRYNTGTDATEPGTPPTAEGNHRGAAEGHESPVEQGTSGDGDDAPVVVADGIGLPEGLSVDEFVDIVKNSRTLYEVQRAMGVERATARTLLREYNLLDFVMGQLAFESELYVTREEVVARIRESELA
jgi:hypothetical protein